MIQMASRRMFAKTIVDSDAFMTMPLSAQALYFHIAVRADDDGFSNNLKSISKLIGANEDDYNLLILKRFIIPFETGVSVIKHWRIHNKIDKQKYTPTKYQEEFARLEINQKDGYSLKPSSKLIPEPRTEELGEGKERTIG